MKEIYKIILSSSIYHAIPKSSIHYIQTICNQYDYFQYALQLKVPFRKNHIYENYCIKSEHIFLLVSVLIDLDYFDDFKVISKELENIYITPIFKSAVVKQRSRFCVYLLQNYPRICLIPFISNCEGSIFDYKVFKCISILPHYVKTLLYFNRLQDLLHEVCYYKKYKFVKLLLSLKSDDTYVISVTLSDIECFHNKTIGEYNDIVIMLCDARMKRLDAEKIIVQNILKNEKDLLHT